MKIRETSLHLVDIQTRMPFKYGIATMTRVPQIFVRVQAEVEGRPLVGISADFLPPKWFTKDPNQPLRAEIEEMIRVIENAARLASGMSGRTVFDIWRQLGQAQAEWGKRERLAPLLTNFGASLIERAIIEAACRAAGRPFWRATQSNHWGINLGELHPILNGKEPNDFLPPQPLSALTARHTVGLADPLTDDSIASEERVSDSLPQSLAQCIRHYRLRHFKIKISGQTEPDLDRLHQVATVIEQHAPADYAFSLDGNEQFKSLTDFRNFWERASHDARLGRFFRHLLFVEQPLHRDLALAPDVAKAFSEWPQRPTIIIDESDAALDSLPTALHLGYAGTSHKNCKGIFKGLANYCLLRQRQIEQPGAPALMSGEDLCNIGPVALLQDLTAMAAFGIGSVERNGHHYCAGLSMYPKTVQDQVLAAHPDLYKKSGLGWPTLEIRSGTIRLETVNRAPFGCGFTLDTALFQSLEEWRKQSAETY